MKKNNLKLSALVLSLGLFNTAYAADQICNSATGCNYIFDSGSKTWHEISSGKFLNQTSDFNVIVPSGNYQNTPVTDNGAITNDFTSQTVRSLFMIRDTGNNNSQLTLQSGVNAILKEDYSTSNIVSIWDTKANLEKNVKLTLEKNYSQIHNIPDAYGDDNGNSAIELHNSILNTQADIEINNDGSYGIESTNYGNGNTIHSSNHSIVMNGNNDIAYLVFGNSNININNVNIVGKNSSAFDISPSEENEQSVINVNNSQINVGDSLAHFGGSSSFTLDNTSTTSNIAIDFNADQQKMPNIITHIKNKSTIKSNTLVAINPTEYIDAIKNDLDDENEDAIANITLNVDHSDVEGISEINLLAKQQGTINLNLNNSHWQFNGDSKLTNLSVGNSDIIFQPSSQFHHLTILNDLSGNGNFTLNTNLADQQSDKIVVQGKDEGSFGLIIKDSGKVPKSANGKVTLVETKSGQAQFRLLNKDYVDAGAYRYRLRKEGTNWVLSNHQSEPVSDTPTTNNVDQGNTAGTTPTQPVSPTAPITPTTPVVPTTPSNNNGAYIATLSGRANALVSLRQAAVIQVEDDLAGIHQRLGELKTGAKNAVWVRNVNSRTKLDGLQTSANSYASGFEQNLHNLQLGVDTSLSDNIRVGGFVGMAHSHVDFNGEYGSGKINSKSVGLYGTYQADNGLYIDNILKYSRLHSQSDATEKRHYKAYTLSSEIGKIFNLADQWTITPQAQLAWTKLSGHADEKAVSSIYSRVGLRVAKGIAFNHWALQPYAEFNAITTRHNAAKIRVDTDDLDVAESRGRFESAIGINAGVGNHRVGIQASRTDGKHLDKPFAIQAVYRYQW